MVAGEGVAGMRRCWRLSGEIVGLGEEAPHDTFARLGLEMVQETEE